jgi:alpha-D-xyloside xylohydrolase
MRKRYLLPRLSRVALFPLFFCTSLPAQVATQNNGIVVFEAENFTTNQSPRSAHSWITASTTAGFSGAGYVEALPNDGTNLNTTPGGANPELQFTVNFTSTGAHHVWFRGYSSSGANQLNDDSVHAGIDGGGSIALTLSQYGVWQWTNTPQTGGGPITINVGSTGTHTFSLWMREDGLKIDRVVLVLPANTFSPTIGNSWHIPTSTEAGITGGMRTPLIAAAGSPVTIYNGNQFQGGVNQGNQLQTGSTVFYKKSTDSIWSSVPMTFFLQSGNNKYFSAPIPASAFAAGDTIQYYLKIPYSDHLPTFLYGSDSASNATEFEAQAQANPFAFTVAPPLQPTGNYLSFPAGQFEARIYEGSGHLALAYPDLAGAPLANVITFAPPLVKIGDRLYTVGHVVSSSPLANGIEVVQAVGATNVTARLTFMSTGVMRYEVTNWNGLFPTESNVIAASDAAEHFYGFGEKFNSFDQAGNKVRMLTLDIPGNKGDAAYKPVPWFVSNRGYGFHLDSTAESFFDMRNGAPDRYVIQNLLGTLKFNVVAGPKLTDVLTRYTGYTGRPYLPPPWVFGTWVSSDIWRNGGEVRYVITKHRDSGIPISAFVFDSPWETAYNDFNWNMTQWGTGGTYEGTNYSGFSSVTDMMTFLQTNGVKVICWMTPFINISSNNEGIPGQNTGQASNYAFAASNNYFVRSSAGGPPLVAPWWKGNGSPVDFTNPAARTWLTGQLQTLVTQSNVTTQSAGSEPAIGGFKTDDGETTNGSHIYIPTTAVYSDGRTGIEMRNGYCIEYHKAISGVLGSNGILFARSGFTGTGAYPAGWPGDNVPNYSQANGLQSVITSGVSAAMSGFPIWGEDIGGYQNSNFELNRADLFMRWSQYGAFTPLMQMHRNVDSNNLEQHPWGYGATALANYVTYAKLHSQLFPYIYTYAKEASTNGLPLIRPLVLLHQTDPLLYAVQHTYYFGNEILVAPMNTANSTTRNVQLPAGNWYDYWTNAKHTGGGTLAWSNADTSKMPLFVRESAIVPMLTNVPQTLCDANYVNNPSVTTMDSAWQFLVYPGPTPATFVASDGTNTQCSVAGTVTTMTLSSGARPVSFKVFAAASPAGVERNGLRLPHLLTQSNFNAASTGWFYDGAAKFLLVKFAHGGGGTTVTFGPDTVGDGVTDSWRDYYGITDDEADNDGDGLTNGQEYFAGTNPNDAQSKFAIQSVAAQSGGGFFITWPSQLGIVYRVQWKNSLSDLSWQSITPDFTGTGAALDWTDDGSQTGGFPGDSRFYRIAVP